MNIYDKVTGIKGIGPKKAALLEKLDIKTIEDLIYCIPRRYEDRSRLTEICDLQPGQTACTAAEVISHRMQRGRYGRQRMLKLEVTDGTGVMEVVFFNAGFMKDRFRKGMRFVFYGNTSRSGTSVKMVHPDFSSEEEAETGIFAVYPLTEGISQKDMRKWQKEVRGCYGQISEIMQEDSLERNRLCTIGYALNNIHFPEDRHKIMEARYRLVFDEFLVMQAGLRMIRGGGGSGAEGIQFASGSAEEEYIKSLPYRLTRAQRRCIAEISADLESTKIMNRLVQGDVGSGKTAVAEAAMYKAVKSGYQAVMMAPTEILAKQHYEGMSRAFEKHGIKVGFLSGSLRPAEKKKVLEGLRSGEIQIAAGTHALIQPEVEFGRLGLVITDEQHRFGVRQRISLKEKGGNPNVLVMTATPIPRTLSAVVFGDLDVSVIDELPPGRQKICTRAVRAGMRKKCYDFMEEQLRQGRQAYVVTPLIEESEAVNARSAVQVAEELAARFPQYKVGLIHGEMKQDEKDRIMADFYEGRINVLTATVVIEVGINVPDATVMVIENAERFGLAQLHQLRGRVGRGSHQSYCFLVLEHGTEIAEKRVRIMESSSDGFYIAEEDLRLRGPGEIFGTRQHGIPDMRIADFAKHMDILEHASAELKRMTDADPELAGRGYEPLRREIMKLFGKNIMIDL